MKRFFISFVVVLMSSMLFAQTPDGLTCETAIPVDKSYEGEIPQAGTYYYRASTYDLPMTCYFYPSTPLTEMPEITVDFTCTPGVYDDPNLAYMIQSASGWGIEMPIPFLFSRNWDDPSREVYSLTIDESYREIMTMFNITYNLDAVVKVNAPCAGIVRMTPDTTFRSCVENSVWLNLPDTIVTGVQHEMDSYVLPFADWQNDSIRFRWTGKETPVTVWIGEDCEFEFKTSGDNCALDMFVLSPDAGNGENIRDFTKAEIKQYISLFASGGVYYLRTASGEDGQLIVERKPMSDEMKNAIQLEINKPSSVGVYDAEQVYFFPTTWEDYSMIWSSSANGAVRAYFSSNVEFEADEKDENVFEVHDFVKTMNGSELALSKKQMKTISRSVSGDHVFVKLISTKSTSITPSLWGVGVCGENTDEIQINDSVILQKNASTTAWRIDIEKWAKQDIKLYWKGTSMLKVFLCDTCKGFSLNQNNEHVKLYKEVYIKSDGSRDTTVLTMDELLNLTEYADADGFLYFRFNNSSKGSLIVKADLPPTTPLSSIALAFDSTVNVYDAFIDTIYHFTDDWAENSVELVASKADTVVAYFGTTDDLDPAQGNYFAAYPFTIEKEQSRLQLSAKQISALLKHTKDGKIYVAFYADHDTQITPVLWNACACARDSYEFLVGGTEAIAARSHDVVYRVNYNYWKDYDVTLHWSGNTTLMAYLATVCDFNMVATNIYVLNSSDVDILPNDTMQIGEEVRLKAIDGGMLPEDGFLYFRFSTNSAGIITPTFYPVNPDTSVDNVIVDKQRNRIICTPDGRIYILVGEERYTILGEKL